MRGHAVGPQLPDKMLRNKLGRGRCPSMLLAAEGRLSLKCEAGAIFVARYFRFPHLSHLAAQSLRPRDRSNVAPQGFQAQCQADLNLGQWILAARSCRPRLSKTKTRTLLPAATFPQKCGIATTNATTRKPSSFQRRRARPGGAREQKFSTSASAPRLFLLKNNTVKASGV